MQIQRWSRLVVRRILDNPRYRGTWQYGATETVWKNKKDYALQVERNEPLAEVELPYLRLIDERTWHEAQRRLENHLGRGGRQPKNGDLPPTRTC